ncbi:hypothetical protein KAH94_05035 [bacterium]|nr:hypothetical protein [bacterium]
MNRLKKIINELNDIGVFYGKNYGGEYESLFPHHSFTFRINLERHRSGFEAFIEDGSSGENDIILAKSSYKKDPYDDLVELFEKSLIKIKKILKDKTCEQQ